MTDTVTLLSWCAIALPVTVGSITYLHAQYWISNQVKLFRDNPRARERDNQNYINIRASISAMEALANLLRDKRVLKNTFPEYGDAIIEKVEFLEIAKELYAKNVALKSALQEYIDFVLNGNLASLPFSEKIWETLENSSLHMPHEFARRELVPSMPIYLGLTELNESVYCPVSHAPPIIVMSSQDTLGTARSLIESMVLRTIMSTRPGMVRICIVDPAGYGSSFSNLNALEPFYRLIPQIACDERSICSSLERLCDRIRDVKTRVLGNRANSLYDLLSQGIESPGASEASTILLFSHTPTCLTQEAAKHFASIWAHGRMAGITPILLLMTNADAQNIDYPEITAGEHIAINLANDDKDGSSLDLLGIEDEDDEEEVDQSNDKLEEKYPNIRYPDRINVVPDAIVSVNMLEFTIDNSAKAIRSLVTIANDEKFRRAGSTKLIFSSLHPQSVRDWVQTTDMGIDVPIGLASGKPHSFRLDGRTSAHALLGGGTGSGKSSYLHALICGCILRYSPWDLELYLIDFKGGTEFKPYADGQLPHARVIALASERELGVNVLESAQNEIRRREDIFKKNNVDNLESYRKKQGKTKDDPKSSLPRLLIIIDEFQGFFLPDDQLAEKSRKLIDLVARQGRSYGIHLLLCTQAMPIGAMAPQTKEQFKVRIALRLSENESVNLLGGKNDAAAKLEGNGQGIFNEREGAIDANVIFQCAWIEKSAGKDSVSDIVNYCRQKALSSKFTRNPMVFEDTGAVSFVPPATNPGKRPSVLGIPIGMEMTVEGNNALWKISGRSQTNFLIAGNQEDIAIGTLEAMVRSILSQDSDPTLRVTVLNLVNPEQEAYVEIVNEWSNIPRCQVERQSRLVATIGEFHAELLRRRAEAEHHTGPSSPTSRWILVFAGIGSARDFDRKPTDASHVSPGNPSVKPQEQPPQAFSLPPPKSVSFGGGQGPSFSSNSTQGGGTVRERLKEILADGCLCGIHVVAWIPTKNLIKQIFSFPGPSLDDFGMQLLISNDAVDDVYSALRIKDGQALLKTSEDQGYTKIRAFTSNKAREVHP